MLHFETRHFLTGEELSASELNALIERAEEMRLGREHDNSRPLLGKTFALLFEKPSLRTRVSFTVGVHELGGLPLELASSQRKNEDPEDSMRVLQGMVHGLMLRTFEHSNLERMKSVATIPIINGLSDSHHPCQALADLQTLKQIFGELKGLKLAYIGDGNNVLHSLLLMLPFVGVDVHYACPEGFQPDPAILARAQQRAQIGQAQIKRFTTPFQAVQGTHAIYTDVWTSMGMEAESEIRAQAFASFQVNRALHAQARTEAIIMHCLPMQKGVEITAEMAEHPQSALFIQAENRLHAQKALLEGIFHGEQLRKRRPVELPVSPIEAIEVLQCKID